MPAEPLRKWLKKKHKQYKTKAALYDALGVSPGAIDKVLDEKNLLDKVDYYLVDDIATKYESLAVLDLYTEEEINGCFSEG